MGIKTPKKAIITAAGLSSSFLPISKIYPREMLAIGCKPVIHYVVEEAIDAGLEEIYIICDDNRSLCVDKESQCSDRNSIVESYFRDEYRDSERLDERTQFKQIKRLRQLSKIDKSFIKSVFKEDDSFSGYVQVINDHKEIFEKNPFVLMFGDVLTKKEDKCTRNLIDAYHYYETQMIAVKNISPFEVNQFGVINASKIGNNIYNVRKIVEKPKKEYASSSLAVMGRYVCDGDFFNYSGGKKYISPILNNMMKGINGGFSKSHPKKIHAQRFFGKSFKIFDEIEFLKAQIEFLVNDKEVYDELIQCLNEKKIKFKEGVI